MYLRNDTSMWDKYVNLHHYHLFDIGDIKTMEFDEFIFFDAEEANQNMNTYLALRDRSILMNTWQTVFDTMLTDTKGE